MLYVTAYATTCLLHAPTLSKSVNGEKSRSLSKKLESKQETQLSTISKKIIEMKAQIDFLQTKVQRTTPPPETSSRNKNSQKPMEYGSGTEYDG